MPYQLCDDGASHCRMTQVMKTMVPSQEATFQEIVVSGVSESFMSGSDPKPSSADEA